MRYADWSRANWRLGEHERGPKRSRRSEGRLIMRPAASRVQHTIAITSLSRRFGSKTALCDVSLNVTPGSVFGLVGENGAGKSTLIKHILGLWRAETGSVRVFGLDPVANPVSVL